MIVKVRWDRMRIRKSPQRCLVLDDDNDGLLFLKSKLTGMHRDGWVIGRALIFVCTIAFVLRDSKATAASACFSFVPSNLQSQKTNRRDGQATIILPLHRSSMSGAQEENQPIQIVSSLPGEERLDEMPVPQSFKEKVKTRLILHFDINETILLGDVSGGDSRSNSLHKIFAKSAFCKIPDDTESSNAKINYEDTSTLAPTHWWDGQGIGSETTTPPLYTGWKWPQNCCPYYRTSYKSRSNNFVEHHGKVYQELFDQTLRKMEQSDADMSTSELSTDSHILPALYHTLHHLIEHGKEQPCTVVFRTFGSDLPDIANAVKDFAQGKLAAYSHLNHPDFFIPPDRLFQGRWKKEEKGNCDEEERSHNMVYQLWDLAETHLVASGDHAILELLDRLPMCGIKDDYPHWAANAWLPTSGKPVWVPCNDNQIDTDKQASSSGGWQYDHHILFDDNIHNLHDDGIACIRQEQADGSFVTLDSESMHQLQGVNLVRVPTVEPVLNPNWFVEQIEQARGRLYQRLWKAKEGNRDTQANA
jgi:hypothetical protein